MKQDNKFFTFIWRVNGLFLFLGGLTILSGGVAALGMLAYSMIKDTATDKKFVEFHNDSSGKDTNEQITKKFWTLYKLGTAEKVQGQDLYFAPLLADSSSDINSYTYSEKGYPRNMLFFSAEDFEHASWLYPSNKYVIRNYRKIEEEKKDGEKTISVTRAILLEVVKEDTNGDGRLATEDKAILAAVKPDGTGYKELITDGKDIKLLSWELTGFLEKSFYMPPTGEKILNLPDQGAFFFFYGKEEGRYFVKFSLDGFKKLQEKQVDLPPEL